MDIAELLFKPGHSIAWDYFSSFPLITDSLGGIHDFILSFPKAGYMEVSEGVWAASDVFIAPSACIQPPCIIGKGTEIRHSAFIRGNAIIGENAVIGNSVEVKNAIISDCAEVPHFNYVGDSILGYKAHMGAGSITSNVKSDKTLVTVKAEGEEFPTGLKKIGAMLGDRVEVGCNSVLNPGTVIGHDSIVYPVSCVRGFVPARHIFKRPGEVAAKRD